jgi:antitoxin component YwqK of YwqJK toxin-antitoxin module
VWYPNGQLYGSQTYNNDTLTGKEAWYYPSGQPSCERFYSNGKPSNLSRSYYDTTISEHYKKLLIKDFYKTEDSLNQEYKRIQVWVEVIYDTDGKELITREYTRQGQIRYESLYDHKRNFVSNISYHKNGRVESIGYTLNHHDYGHYQAFDENGLPLKSWDYDETGKQINIKMPEEMMERYRKMRGK